MAIWAKYGFYSIKYMRILEIGKKHLFINEERKELWKIKGFEIYKQLISGIYINYPQVIHISGITYVNIDFWGILSKLKGKKYMDKKWISNHQI